MVKNPPTNAGDIEDLDLIPGLGRSLGLIQCGALGSAMTGSGPTVFGIFDREDPAKEAADQLGRLYTEVFLTRPVGGHSIG